MEIYTNVPAGAGVIGDVRKKKEYVIFTIVLTRNIAEILVKRCSRDEISLIISYAKLM